MSPVIKTNNITKVFNPGINEVRALRGISVEIADGEFVSIMGASGSGKSTFLNIIGCLDQSTAGTYLLEGVEVSGLTGKELSTIRNQKFGFVFQSYNLLARTSALENVNEVTIDSIYIKRGIAHYNNNSLNNAELDFESLRQRPASLHTPTPGCD